MTGKDTRYDFHLRFTNVGITACPGAHPMQAWEGGALSCCWMNCSVGLLGPSGGKCSLGQCSITDFLFGQTPPVKGMEYKSAVIVLLSVSPFRYDYLLGVLRCSDGRRTHL